MYIIAVSHMYIHVFGEKQTDNTRPRRRRQEPSKHTQTKVLQTGEHKKHKVELMDWRAWLNFEQGLDRHVSKMNVEDRRIGRRK